jgi:hypothetical protein
MLRVGCSEVLSVVIKDTVFRLCMFGSYPSPSPSPLQTVSQSSSSTYCQLKSNHQNVEIQSLDRANLTSTGLSQPQTLAPCTVTCASNNLHRTVTRTTNEHSSRVARRFDHVRLAGAITCLRPSASRTCACRLTGDAMVTRFSAQYRWHSLSRNTRPSRIHTHIGPCCL